MSTGEVRCWGANVRGQVKTGGTTTRELTPVTVSLPKNVTAISAGHIHTCVMYDDGEAACFGGNGVKQVADATGDVFMATTLYNGPSELAAGKWATTCVREGAGAFAYLCRGLALNGQGFPGNIDSGTSSTTLEIAADPVLGPDGYWLTVGSYHACITDVQTGLYCWGNNGAGQLGDGTTNTPTGPVPVLNLGADESMRVESLALGDLHTCATVGGALKCWGAGQAFGPGTNEVTPLNITVPGGARVVTAGFRHSCVLTTAGEVRCGGTGYDWTTPIDGLGSDSASALATGWGHNCAIMSDEETVKCWGANTEGQLGSGDILPQAGAVTVQW